MDIDSLYEEALKTLTADGKIIQISKELLTLTNNEDRVLKVYDILEDLNMFPRSLLIKKSEPYSQMYRDIGNKCFQNCKHYEAWQYYNLALLYAPINSKHYAFAIANRSAVLYSLTKYEECLKDIAHVWSMDYPPQLKSKLLNREAKCKEILSGNNLKDNNNNINVESIMSMKGSKNSKYQCASDAINVIYSEEMGHHVVAKRNIEAGELIAEEDPYLILLLKTQYLFSCTYCMSRIANLLPCYICCFSLYCSIRCMENAWKDYHKYECPLMAILIALKFTKLELLALRTVIKARCDHENWDSLFETIAKAETNLKNENRGCIQINGEWIYDSKSYTAIHALASNVEKRSVSDIFRKAVTAAVFLRLLQNDTEFLIQDKGNKMVIKCVAGLLLHHIMTSPTNMHGISTVIATASGKYTEDIELGCAPYAFFSLLNHSCAPNVVRNSSLGCGKMKLFAIRFIKKGMQLYDNYGPHHALENRESRRSTLQFQYKFQCSCEACVYDWPTYIDLGKARNLPLTIRKKKESIASEAAIQKLKKGCEETAKALFKPLCELITVLEAYAPCVELADCQESLKQCISILQGVLPYGYSQLVPWDDSVALKL